MNTHTNHSENIDSQHEVEASSETQVDEAVVPHHRTHSVHAIKEHLASGHETPTEPMVHDSAPVDSIVSFRLSRQTLVLSALVILLGVSAFETVELTRLHRALAAWKALPAVAASPTTSAPTTAAPTSSGNGLPSQVGGC